MSGSFYEIVARAVFSEQTFNDFFKFFQTAWEKHYDYRVAMTRRCYNLHWAFREIATAKDIAPASAHEVISQDALLSYAEEIAACYAKSGDFPSILVMDDVLLYGRGVVRVLYNLENLVLEFLTKHYGEESRGLRYAVHHRLLDSVTIHVVAKGKRDVLMDHSYLYKVKYNKELYQDELLELSRDITDFLRKIDLPNNSNMLSLLIPRTAITQLESSRNGWAFRQWEYDKTLHDVFVRHRVYKGRRYTDSVRVTLDGYYREDNAVWLTAMSQFHGVMPLVKLEEICQQLERCLDGNEVYEGLRRKLTMSTPLLQKQRTRVLLLLLSLVCLHDFWQTYALENIAKLSWEKAIKSSISDLYRLSGTFARSDDTAKELIALCSDCDMILRLSNLISGDKIETAFSEKAGSFRNANYCSEEFFYWADSQSEKNAYQYARSQRGFDPRSGSADIVALDDFLNNAVHEWESFHKTQTDLDQNELLTSALVMHHHAIIAVGCETHRDEERVIDGVECTLKAGELSMYVVPKRFYLLLPALACVEEYCIESAQAPEEAVHAFIQWLRVRPGADDGEQEQLEQLRGIGNVFVETLYSCNKSIRRWSRGLFRGSGWSSESGERFVDCIKREKAIEQYYVQQAKHYIEERE